MITRSDLKPLPLREANTCFGCGPRNDCGLHMRFHTDGQTLYSWLKIPSHLSGWRNIVHGGILTTILDEIMGWSAIYLMKSLVLTKSITIEFLKPVYVEDEIRAEGKIIERVSEREVLMEGVLFNSSEKLCSKSRGAFAVFPPEMALKSGMMDEANLEELDRLISS